MKKDKMLSEREKRRMERFEKLTEEMKKQNFVCRNLTVSIMWANILSIIVMIFMVALGYGLYHHVNTRLDFARFDFLSFIVVFVVLVAVHEGIHAICWCVFSPNHYRDVEFGIMKPSMSPYAACLAPLKKWQYIVGVMMPMSVLGVIPYVVGIMIAKPFVVLMGAAMIAIASGDMMICARVIGYKSDSLDTVYMDHPTEAGGVVFER